MKDKRVVKRIQPIDTDILWGLYQLRALSTEQIRRRYGLTHRYTYRKLDILRNTGWLISEQISGYLKKQKRQGSYHRISETGIACLKKQGYPVERKWKANDLRIGKRHLPYLLNAYDIFIDLEPFDWKLVDSRAVKARYFMNRGDSLQGILESPAGREYIFYVLMESTTERTLARIASEIISHSKLDRLETHRPTANYFIFVRGQKAFAQVTEHFRKNRDALNTVQQLKIMPTGFARLYLRALHEEQSLLDYLKLHEVRDITRTAQQKLKKTYKGLKTLVEHTGEEKYLVNLLDSDLTKVLDILAYRREQYETDGRRILVVTTDALHQSHQHMLKAVQHIELLPLPHSEMMEYLKGIKPARI